MERISFEEVQAFIQKLNQLTGKAYRLPTEAEWEYTCRAGEDFKYCGGNDLNAVAWHYENSGQKTHRVGSKQANAFGLYDMSGNVSEWVQDCYHDTYQGAPVDGSAWVDGKCSRQVLRGGSWRNIGRFLRSAYRNWLEPDNWGSSIGFRLALSQTGQ